jgi:AhpD family alkylhydroperoxidase
MEAIQYAGASERVRAVYDDIKATRGVPDVNNFWKLLANHPETLERTWSSVKQVMADGALDPLTKELIYYAVSVSNNCRYCMASHSAAALAKGADADMLMEVLAVVGMANETNRLANGYDVPIDDAFRQAW